MTHTNDKNIFGFWVYLMSDCVLFAALFATYMVRRGATFGHAGAYDLANLPYVFGETMLLLTSSFTIGLAVHFATKGTQSARSGALAQVKPTLYALVATLILGLGFLGMEVHEFANLIAESNGPNASAFLSSFFVLLGTHGLHVFVGALWMAVLILRMWRKGLSESLIRKLTILSLFWHFLDVIWIFIFTFVYLFGALAL